MVNFLFNSTSFHLSIAHIWKKCPICGLDVETKTKLENHISTMHEGVKPYQCSVCDAKFSYQRTLKGVVIQER